MREQRRGSQPFHQIERELMRGWRAFSIRERSREQGDGAWLQPGKDPESESSEGPFLLIFFGKFKKRMSIKKKGKKDAVQFLSGCS